MARLFVAVHPPTEVLDVIERIDRPDHPGLRWTTRDQWHLTLRFLGEVDDPGRVVSALEGMEALEPPEVVLGPGVRRWGSRVLVVPAAGLGDLAAAVVAVTAGIGRPPERRPFRGHLTVARIRPGHPRPPVPSTTLDARFRATTVDLVESRLSPTGARYTVLHRRALPGPPGSGDR